MKFGGDSKEPKGALAALLPGASSPSSSPDPLADTDHGFRAVAKAFGIPPEREASAQAALKQYIKQCVGSAESDEELPGEEY